ncbi:hypothetical protein JCM17380_32580 [Desulfosporosinus burensis]
MKKKFLKITGIMVLIMALVGFWGYNKYFKPDPEIQQQLDNQFGPGFFNSFTDQKDGKSGLVNNDVSSNNEVKPENDVSNNEVIPHDEEKPIYDSDKKTDLPNTSTPVNEAIAKVITLDEITLKYTPQFDYLQNVALSRLDTLYSAAIQEYVQRSKAGTLNRSELAQKYIQAGNLLEANVNSQFYSTLDALQAELMANNYPTDSVRVIKTEYEKAKSAKRSQLLAKMRN